MLTQNKFANFLRKKKKNQVNLENGENGGKFLHRLPLSDVTCNSAKDWERVGELSPGSTGCPGHFQPSWILGDGSVYLFWDCVSITFRSKRRYESLRKYIFVPGREKCHKVVYQIRKTAEAKGVRCKRMQRTQNRRKQRKHRKERRKLMS